MKKGRFNKRVSIRGNRQSYLKTLVQPGKVPLKMCTRDLIQLTSERADNGVTAIKSASKAFLSSSQLQLLES